PRQAARDELATDLEREQRVAERRVRDAVEEVPRRVEPEPGGEELAERAPAERADLDALDRPLLEHPPEGGGNRGPPRHEEGDGLLLEPARREGERVGGGSVEPLQIVDRDEHR